MRLQIGKFLIKNIDELESLETDKDGLKSVIMLSYMGDALYERNTIPFSRMRIEYNIDNYAFYPVDICNMKNEQMFIYANSDVVERNGKDFLIELAKRQIDLNMSLWQAVNHPIGALKFEDLCDFWWDIQSDYFIFFGEEKKAIINYFISGCYERDGKRERITNTLKKGGFKL